VNVPYVRVIKFGEVRKLFPEPWNVYLRFARVEELWLREGTLDAEGN